MDAMLSFYPPIAPYLTHNLRTDTQHTIYVEECGNPKGVPVLFLHDGPGLGCHDLDRSYFDPDHYRILLFDQRGCGRSTPHLELKDNDTEHLLKDIELICETLNIDKFLIFGCGWGATLALAYAQKHPLTVIGLILQGVFLNRTEDVKWFYSAPGVNHIFPDHWQEFVSVIPNDQHHSLLPMYAAIFNGGDDIAKMRAAKAWSAYKAKCASLEPNDSFVKWLTQPSIAMGLARLECHYLIHNNFLQPNQIINNLNAITKIPGIIIHGRYDMICPFNNAWLLHNAWPQSSLRIIPNSGHAPTEPMIVDAIIHATNEMRRC